MMRRSALAMGAAVLAAVPVVTCGNIAASAEYLPSWEQWRSLYDYNLIDPTVQFLYTDDVIAPYWRYYASAVMAVVEGVYINGNYEITPGDFSGVSGYYLLDGVRRFGSLYASGVHSSVTVVPGEENASICAVWSLQDGAMEVSLVPSDTTAIYNYTTSISDNIWSLSYRRTNQTRPHTTVYFHGTGICDDVSIWNNTIATSYFAVLVGGDAAEWRGSSADYIGVNTMPYSLLGEAVSFPSLPVNDAFPTISVDNALDYVADVLNPYMQEIAPETVPYLFNPREGDPVYPTGETVQGMPKEWTIENPALPSYNLDLQLPTADYEAVDVVTPINQNASGIQFWWAMLGTLLDHFGLKSLVVLACALGLFLLVLTRLGR